MSRSQLATSARGSVYFLSPLIVPLDEKSSAKHQNTEVKHRWYQVDLTLIGHAFDEAED